MGEAFAASCRRRSAGYARRPRRGARDAAAAQTDMPRSVADDDWGDIFSSFCSSASSRSSGSAAPTIPHEYPCREAALARPKPGRIRFCRALRALCLRRGDRQRLRRTHDAGEQRAPLRGGDGREAARSWRAYPIDEDFLAALDVMPQASGVALGFDRLAMLAAGARADRAGDLDAGRRSWRGLGAIVMLKEGTPASPSLNCGS